MPTKKEYNGYTNYETWNCALWLDNDQGTQLMMQEKAIELVEAMDNPNDKLEIETATQDMEAFLESIVDDMQETMGFHIEASMFSDMLNAALREIDYYDIAESQLADALRERQESVKGAA